MDSSVIENYYLNFNSTETAHILDAFNSSAVIFSFFLDYTENSKDRFQEIKNKIHQSYSGQVKANGNHDPGCFNFSLSRDEVFYLKEVMHAGKKHAENLDKRDSMRQVIFKINEQQVSLEDKVF